MQRVWYAENLGGEGGIHPSVTWRLKTIYECMYVIRGRIDICAQVKHTFNVITTIPKTLLFPVCWACWRCLPQVPHVLLTFAVVWLLVGLVVRYPRLLGDGFVAFPPLSTGFKEFQVTVYFRPETPNGLIVLSADQPDADQDFFSLALLNGRADFRQALIKFYSLSFNYI